MQNRANQATGFYMRATLALNGLKKDSMTRISRECCEQEHQSEASLQRCPQEKVFWKYTKSYRKTPMPKCDFSKVALQLYRNHTSTWVFSFRAPFFRNTFEGLLLANLRNTLERLFLITTFHLLFLFYLYNLFSHFWIFRAKR